MPSAFQRFAQRLLGLSPAPPVASKAAPPGGFLPITGRGAIGGREPAEAITALAPQYYRSWVYACITTIADEVAKIDLCLYQRKPNGDIVKVDNHPAIDLLQRVNSTLTGFDLWYMTSTYMDIYGEAFWWIVRDGKKIIGIFPWLNPSNMDVNVNESGMMTGYQYRIPGKQEVITYGADEILHFKFFNPQNPYRGMSPIQAANFAIATDKEAAAFNWRFFKNDATPGGFLVYPGTLTDDQAARIKTQWSTMHQGSDNASKMAVLENGMEWKDSAISQRDMNFLEGRNFNRDEIFTIFKVPRALLNPDASITRANAETTNLYFFERTIEPRIRRFVATLNEFLLPQFDRTESLFFDFENTGPRDLEADIKYYESGLNNGWLSRNEVRAQEGRDEFQGGDKLTIPFNLVDVGTVPKKKTIDPKTLRVKKARSLSELLYADSLALAKKALHNKYQTKTSTAKKSMPKQEVRIELAKDDQAMKRRLGEGAVQVKRARNAGEQRAFINVLNDEFSRQRKEVLASVQETEAKAAKKNITFDFDPSIEADLFAKVFLPIVRDIVKVHGEDALRLLGTDGFDVNRATQEFIKREGLAFTKQINRTTQDNIRTEIAAGLEEGEGIESIRRRISGVFEEAETWRARMIAQTEVNRASTFGIEQGYVQSDVVAEKEWYTPLDVDDEVCVPMHGTTVKLGEQFDLPDGGTVDGPPAHPNCHCTVLPVLDKNKTAGRLLVAPVVIHERVPDAAATNDARRATAEATKVVADLANLRDRIARDLDNDDHEKNGGT